MALAGIFGTRDGPRGSRPRQDLEPERSFLVYSGDERYPRGEGVEVIGLTEMASLLAAA